MSVKWQDEELGTISDLIEQEKTFDEIILLLTEMFGESYRTYTFDSVRNAARRYIYPHINKKTTEARVDRLDKHTLLTNADKSKIVHSKKPKPSKRKILTIGCTHIPLEEEEMLRRVIGENKDSDILVLCGDFLDMYCVSSFEKNKTLALQEEYTKGMSYLKEWSNIFPKIVMVRGNHEQRLNRYFTSRIGPEVQFLVKTEILGLMANGIVPNETGELQEKYELNNVYYVGGKEPWWMQIGDAIFCHPSSFSKTKGKTGVDTIEHFMNKVPSMHTCVVFHTHRQNKIIHRAKMCIEGGCLCKPMEYASTGKLNYEPQTLGYVVVYQDEDGITDFNRSTFIYEGTVVEQKAKFEDIIGE